MAWPTIVTGAVLIVVGVAGYAAQDPNAGAVSGTALIPAGFGAALAVCGLLAFNDRFRRHAMHAAAALALVGALGAPYPIVKRLVVGKDVAFHEPAVASSAATTVICLVFLAACVHSFRRARRLRGQPG